MNVSLIKDINYTKFHPLKYDTIVKKSIVNNIPKENLGSINEPSVIY